MTKLVKKEVVSQAPSEKYFGFLKEIFERVDIPSVPERFKNKEMFQQVSVNITEEIANPSEKEEFISRVEDKLKNFIYFEKADIENTDEIISIRITGYMEKFNPLKYLFFVQKTIKQMVYDSHKMDITIEENEKLIKFVVHSYTKDFQKALVRTLEKMIDSFEKIKQYEVVQNKNSLDAFELIMIGRKK